MYVKLVQKYIVEKSCNPLKVAAEIISIILSPSNL